MIKLRKLNGKEFVVNCELIQYIEETPDTVLTLTTGQKIIVTETADEIINKVIEYKAEILKRKSNAYGKEV